MLPFLLLDVYPALMGVEINLFLIEAAFQTSKGGKTWCWISIHLSGGLSLVSPHSPMFCLRSSMDKLPGKILFYQLCVVISIFKIEFNYKQTVFKIVLCFDTLAFVMVFAIPPLSFWSLFSLSLPLNAFIGSGNDNPSFAVSSPWLCPLWSCHCSHSGCLCLHSFPPEMTLIISHVSVLTHTWEAYCVKFHICCKLNASYLDIPGGSLCGHWLEGGVCAGFLLK